jgi:hypothetical protein
MHLWRPSLSVLALALHGVMHCSPVKESLVYITLDFIAVVSYSTLLAWAFWANVTVVRACVCVCVVLLCLVCYPMACARTQTQTSMG